jgi:hypothetical protein
MENKSTDYTERTELVLCEKKGLQTLSVESVTSVDSFSRVQRIAFSHAENR